MCFPREDQQTYGDQMGGEVRDCLAGQIDCFYKQFEYSEQSTEQSRRKEIRSFFLLNARLGKNPC